MPLVILPVFIQAGQSLSDPVDCSAGPIIKITQPGAWTIDAPTGGPAALTFQTSSDGIMFNDVFDPAGNELSYVVIAGTGVIGMRLTTGWVKFRSGTRARPVPQIDLREFAVALDVPAAAAGSELRVRLVGGFAP
jgi:hypothetical protein